MSEENKGTITIKKDTLWKYATFSLLGIIVLGAIFFILPGNSPTGNVVADGGQQIVTAKVQITEADHILGNPNAPVIIVEYSDYECPFCERFHSETFGQIKSQYIDTGKVAFIYRHFPLNFHPNAQKAAEASECAAEQEKFWEMHEMLFESGVQGGVQTYITYATVLGLNTEQFSECLNSGKYVSRIQADMTQGQKEKISGTPGFFIGKEGKDYQLVSGAQPFNNFKQVIDSKL
ncbi:disulfide bond formation protein DsbA [Candidatus Pacearchaeota archaeon CG10_big_fil_rev_8_21_14_0_10_34_76]|nr:MAG: disulfide bond formation protein DsbA [Candidatus Pacearchaeota archaeon CG10_big_fil_rev_8_21_14_0_10_34_76]